MAASGAIKAQNHKKILDLSLPDTLQTQFDASSERRSSGSSCMYVVLDKIDDYQLPDEPSSLEKWNCVDIDVSLNLDPYNRAN